jgi:nucleoside-diphosphate-sugar epimerase
MASARYLVTGGAGFIGSHIAQTLLGRGESVRVLDNRSTGRDENLAALAGRAEIIEGDVRDLATVRAAVAGVEVVFHEAAIASVPWSVADPLMTLEVNVTGTQHVLLAARDARVRRVVCASSSAVYGDAPELPKREDMPPCLLSPYALHKLTSESLCALFTRLYGLETVALRYFNVYGPRQDPASEYAAVIPRFLETLLQGGRPTVFGDGEQTRDFTYIADVVEANLLAATAPAAVSAAVNIGRGERISLNSILRTMCELLGVAVAPEYGPPRAGDVRDSQADISLARRLLGYDPVVPLAEGLARTLDALQAAQARAGRLG